MKKVMLLRLAVLLCFVSVFLVACTSGSSSDKSVMDQEIGTDVALNVVIPALTEAQSQISNLHDAVDTFVASPSETNLEDLQSAWRLAADAWQYTLAFEFGPVDDNDAGSRIWFWPKRIGDIETVLLDDTAINDEFMASIGGSKTGLPVLEFLIFSHTRSNADIVADYTGDSASRYKDYVSAVADDLVSQITSIRSSWVSEYGAVLGSDNMAVSTLINAMVSILEEVQVSKVGKPKGDSSGGVTRPEDVESQYAEYSIQAIRKNIQSVEAVFLSGDSSDEYTGMDDYVTQLGNQTLNDDILAQFDAVESALDGVTDPLWQAVDTQATQVSNLQEEITALIRLIKVDLASALNETIYFTDSDGD
jgi:predicted lipoprotein